MNFIIDLIALIVMPIKMPLALRKTHKHKAFTLVELLTAITVLAVLAAIIIATARRVIEHANSSQCQSNLRQIGIAAKLYINDHNYANPRVNFWTRDLSPYVLSMNLDIMTMPQDETDTPFHCPASHSEDIEGPPNHNKNTTYGQNGTRYGGMNALTLDYQGGTTNPAETITYLDAKTYNVFDTTYDRVGIDWHPGHINACFGDGHVESLGDDLVGTVKWRNYFWGYPRN